MVKRVFALSLTTLYLELLIIRWVSTEFSFLAYLQNSVLVVCLFGFGFGLLRSSVRLAVREFYLPLFILSFLICTPFVRIRAKNALLGLSVFHDFVSWTQAEQTTPVLTTLIGVAGLFCIFNIITLIFIPWGSALGGCFKFANTAKERLSLYGANLVGSLAGIVLFGVLSAFSFPPVSWLVILAALLFICLVDFSKNRLLLLLGCIVLPLFQFVSDRTSGMIETYWTPYQKIELSEKLPGNEYNVIVNNSGYQQIQNNSKQYLDSQPGLVDPDDVGLSQYDIPSLLKPEAKKILIVGAGTGNDVAGALRNTQAEITAVEIDPVILEIGRRLHPESPYQSNRIKVVLDDARAFFENSTEKYDLIIFGLLDSHTTPNLTSARLDHFVYTDQSLNAVSKMLSDHGVLCLVFAPQRDFIIERLAKLMHRTFGIFPPVIHIPPDEQGWGGWLFVGGDLKEVTEKINNNKRLSKYVFNHLKLESDIPDTGVSTTTDDCPYLYLREPRVPFVFSIFLTVIILVVVLRVKSEESLAALSVLPSSVESSAMLLGTGFALTETYGVARAALLFGSTWVPNLIVISAILIMAFFANLVTMLGSNLVARFALFILPVSAFLCGIIKLDFLLELPLAPRYIVSLFIFALPLFFSGIIFSKLIADEEQPERILAWNLFGALVGALLHYLSYLYGFCAVGLVGAAVYLTSVVMLLMKGRKGVSQEA